MDITDLATPNGAAIDLTEVGTTIEGTLTSIGDWRDIKSQFGTVAKAPFNLKVGEEDRTLWVKKNSRMATVIGAAFKDAGLTTLVTGGTLKVQRVADVPTNKGNDMHDFRAKYTPATSSGVDLEDF